MANVVGLASRGMQTSTAELGKLSRPTYDDDMGMALTPVGGGWLSYYSPGKCSQDRVHALSG